MKGKSKGSPNTSPPKISQSMKKHKTTIFDQSEGEDSQLTIEEKTDISSSIEEYSKNIKRIKKKINENEEEIKAIKYRLESQSQKHSKEVQIYKTEVNELMKGREDMIYKLSLVDKLSNSIVLFYLKTVDRSSQILSSLNQKHVNYKVLFNAFDTKMKSDLLEENPIVLLEKLGANLRVLLDFKKSFSNEMKDKISEQSNIASSSLIFYTKRLRELEKEKSEYLLKQKDSLKEKTVANESMKETIKNSNITIRRYQKLNEKLMDEIKRSEEIINEFHVKLDEREKELRQREIQKNKIQQLESLKLETTHKHRYEKNKIQSEIYQIYIFYERRKNHLMTMQREKLLLLHKIEKVDKKISDLFKHASRKRVLALERRSNKLKDIVIKAEKEKNFLYKNNLNLTVKMEKLRLENSKINVKFNRLQKKSEIANASKHTALLLLGGNDNIEEEKERKRKTKNDELINEFNKGFFAKDKSNFFKKKCSDKEKEIQQLKLQIKKFRRMDKRRSRRKKKKDNRPQFLHASCEREIKKLEFSNKELIAKIVNLRDEIKTMEEEEKG